MNIIHSYNRELVFLKKIGILKYIMGRFPKLALERLTKRKHAPNRKQEALKIFQERYSLTTLLETGTYLGEMVHAMQNRFQKIYSIELDPELYKNAKKRFATAKHVTIYKGDSGKILPQILEKIREPVLFWLDAHYSEGITARGTIDTPIMKELESIFDHQIKNHVILIDDARYFNGTDGYPTVEKLEAYVRAKAPHCALDVQKNIIRIYPRI